MILELLSVQSQQRFLIKLQRQVHGQYLATCEPSHHQPIGQRQITIEDDSARSKRKPKESTLTWSSRMLSRTSFCHRSEAGILDGVVGVAIHENTFIPAERQRLDDGVAACDRRTATRYAHMWL